MSQIISLGLGRGFIAEVSAAWIVSGKKQTFVIDIAGIALNVSGEDFRSLCEKHSLHIRSQVHNHLGKVTYYNK